MTVSSKDTKLSPSTMNFGCSLLPKNTPLMWTDLFGRMVVYWKDTAVQEMLINNLQKLEYFKMCI